eukprot:TRINITY_DN41316_c0_g1_i1.p1 TRINITY_DN41316_c0_g1~~TRINITY_DN41316_c0_g1_i1.p1  ORF type:complete len:816 (-),score=161.74 TRINITY_DN41316_c0_g1_i1:415-2862(-)
MIVEAPACRSTWVKRGCYAKFYIRRARPKDRGAIVKTVRDQSWACAAHGLQVEKTIVDDELAAFWMPDKLRRQETWVYEDTRGSKLVVMGAYTLQPTSLGRGSKIALADIAVSSHVARRGDVMFVLCSHLLRTAAQQGYTGVQLTALPAGKRGELTACRACGFELLGAVCDGFARADGSDPNLSKAWIMFCDLLTRQEDPDGVFDSRLPVLEEEAAAAVSKTVDPCRQALFQTDDWQESTWRCRPEAAREEDFPLPRTPSEADVAASLPGAMGGSPAPWLDSAVLSERLRAADAAASAQPCMDDKERVAEGSVAAPQAGRQAEIVLVATEFRRKGAAADKSERVSLPLPEHATSQQELTPRALGALQAVAAEAVCAAPQPIDLVNSCVPPTTRSISQEAMRAAPSPCRAACRARGGPHHSQHQEDEASGQRGAHRLLELQATGSEEEQHLRGQLQVLANHQRMSGERRGPVSQRSTAMASSMQEQCLSTRSGSVSLSSGDQAGLLGQGDTTASERTSTDVASAQQGRESDASSALQYASHHVGRRALARTTWEGHGYTAQTQQYSAQEVLGLLDDGFARRVERETSFEELTRPEIWPDEARVGDHMLWTIRRAFLDDPTLDTIDFRDMHMPSPDTDARFSKSLVDCMFWNTHLRFLTLSNSNLKKDEGLALAQALMMNTSVQELRVEGNDLEPCVVTMLASAIAINEQLPLKSLVLMRCDETEERGFGLEAERCLAEMVLKKPSLLELQVRCDDAHSAETIEIGLRRNSAQTLELLQADLLFEPQEARRSLEEKCLAMASLDDVMNRRSSSGCDY